MKEYLGSILRKIIRKNKIGISDYFAVITLVLVLVLSIIFKFNFKYSVLTDNRLFAAYPTAVPTAKPTAACNNTCSGGAVHESSCPAGYTGSCSDVSGCSTAYICCSCTFDQSKCVSSCPSGQIHSGECSNGTQSNCALVTQPYSECNPYTCCDCPCTDCTGGTAGDTAYCSAFRNYPPTVDDLIIQNNLGNDVAADSSGRNQICQSDFNNSRLVTFQVNINDLDGISDIQSVTLTLNGKSIPRISGIDSTTVFATTFDNTWNNSSIYPLIATVTDSHGASGIYNSRSFKIWDCQIPISGTIYDATEASSPFCPTNGFSKLPDASVLNFNSLTYVNDAGSKNMTINSNGISYVSGSDNGLTWGNEYIPKFNDKISLSDSVLRSQSSSEIDQTCGNWYVDTQNIDPYVNSPTITADFSGILVQDPWWQVNGGGVVSNSKVNGQVPVTCTDNCKISLNGLVSAPEVTNDTTKSLNEAQDWFYGDVVGNPNTNAKLANVNTNYNYFYNQFLVKKGVGTTLTGDKTILSLNDLGSDVNGVYFINGNLTIAGDIITTNKFLMIVVNGNITVTQDVKNVNGILVANNIYATGTSDNKLIFSGSLFAFNNVDFSRGYTTKLTNNYVPAVVVNFDPGLAFNMPASVAKILTNWQWGN